MNATRKMADGLRARLVELGGQPVADERAVVFDVAGRTAALAIPDPAEVPIEAAYAAASRALMTVGRFATDANAIHRDPRRSEVAKAEDLAALAGPAAADLQRELAAAGVEVERARLDVNRETAAAPVPRAADAVEAIADVEKRGLIRGLAVHDAMRIVEGDRAQCLALLREPSGFPAALIDHARASWARFEPGAALVSDAGARLSAWTGARDAIGAAVAAHARLSAGRGGPVAAAAA